MQAVMLGPQVKPEDDPRIHAMRVASALWVQEMLARVSTLRHAACMGGYVYMMASQKRGTIYTGVTADLSQRVFDHKSKLNKRSFTAQYGVLRLVWYEEHDDIRDAIQREKSIKRWYRQWKIDLIEKTNPEWHELYKGMGW
jgi:putative endonuclease